MAEFNVVLIKEVSHLGKTGDLIKAKPGFARNYLLPKGLAVLVTTAEAKKLLAIRDSEKAEVLAKKKVNEAQIESLQGKVLKFKLKTNQSGKLFGSVSKKDMAKKLGIGEEMVRGASIKTLGEHRISVQEGVRKVEVIVVVEKEK